MSDLAGSIVGLLGQLVEHFGDEMDPKWRQQAVDIMRKVKEPLVLEYRELPKMIVDMGLLPWRPISELLDRDRYGDQSGFLLLAPELVDEDCNVHGVGMGYWQDDGLLWHASQEECDSWPEDRPRGSWMACKWSMTNDEWSHVCCTPTHYLRLRGLA